MIIIFRLAWIVPLAVVCGMVVAAVLGGDEN